MAFFCPQSGGGSPLLQYCCENGGKPADSPQRANAEGSPLSWSAGLAGLGGLRDGRAWCRGNLDREARDWGPNSTMEEVGAGAPDGLSCPCFSLQAPVTGRACLGATGTTLPNDKAAAGEHLGLCVPPPPRWPSGGSRNMTGAACLTLTQALEGIPDSSGLPHEITVSPSAAEPGLKSHLTQPPCLSCLALPIPTQSPLATARIKQTPTSGSTLGDPNLGQSLYSRVTLAGLLPLWASEPSPVKQRK